jgi:FG-GAP-like repeat
VDLDGDGDRDLAVTSGTLNRVEILRNNGSGRFAEIASSPEFVGGQPNSIDAADDDGDSDLDLLTANTAGDDVTVLRNNGHGNFVQAASSPESVGDNPTSVVAIDLDGDLDPDLAVANQDADTVSILRNRGNGNFTELSSSPESSGDGPKKLAAGDLDGDGDADLAIADTFGSTVTLLRNDGAGDFVPYPGSPKVGGQFPSAIALPDIDGDADRDLVFSNGGSQNVSVFRNLGGGNFAQLASSPESIGGGSSPSAIQAADLEGDGDQDLVVAVSGSDGVAVLRNPGAGNFALVPTSPETVGDFPVDVQAADLDGDTDPDLAIPNANTDNVTILRNR